jgi:hypothetical protein
VFHHVIMTSSRVRTAIAVVAVSGVLIALTSCAPATGPQNTGGTNQSAGPTPALTPTPTPTPTVSTLDRTPPTPLSNLSCDQFVSQAQLTAAFGSTPVTAIQTPAIATGDLQNQNALIPAMDYVREVGGITCLWTNSPVNYYYNLPTNGGFPPYKTIQVSVLFNAHNLWPKVEQLEDVTGDYGSGSCDLGICELDEYIGGSMWMNATELNQNSAHDPFPAIIDHVKALLLAGGAVGADPTPAAGTLPLGHSCTDFVANADVSTALGGSPVVSLQPVNALDDLQFYGIWSGAQDALGAHPCEWKRGSAVVGHLSWLAGGAWAWNEAQALPYLGAPAQPLAVPGLPNGDTAFIRCTAGDASCVADLILGGNWIEAQVAQPGTTNRAAVTAVAAAIVTKVG